MADDPLETNNDVEPDEGSLGSNGNGHTLVRSPRTKNTLQVLDALLRKSPITQPQLIEYTELSRGTIASILRHLIERELVEAASPGISGPEGGRRPSAVQLRGDAAVALSVDFGLRHVYVARGNLSGLNVHVRAVSELDVAGDSSGAIEAAVPLIEQVMSDVEPRDLVGVCVGLPAPIDQKRQQIASTQGITSWTGVRPGVELRYRLGQDWSDVRFIVENDANLAALSEFEHGAAQPRNQDSIQDVVIVLKWSDGIGAAAMIDGVTVRGQRGLAAEFGHTTVKVDTDHGPTDICPRCGHVCLERVAGGAYLTARLRKSDDDTFADIIKRAVEADGEERKAIHKAARCIGRVLGLYVTLLNPRLIVVSGRHFGSAPHGIDAYRLIADPMRSGMNETGFPASLEDVDIALGERTDLAAAEGGVIAMMRAGLQSFLEQRLTMEPVGS